MIDCLTQYKEIAEWVWLGVVLVVLVVGLFFALDTPDSGPY